MEAKFKYTKIKQSGTVKLEHPINSRFNNLSKEVDKLLTEITSLNLFVKDKLREAWIVNYNLKQIGKTNDTN